MSKICCSCKNYDKLCNNLNNKICSNCVEQSSWEYDGSDIKVELKSKKSQKNSKNGIVFINSLTVEMDRFSKIENIYYTVMTNIMLNENEEYNFRYAFIESEIIVGHIVINKNNMITDISLYPEYIKYYEEEVVQHLNKYIGMKLVLEEEI